MSARAVRVGPGAVRALAEGAAGTVAVPLSPTGGYLRIGERWVLVAPPRAPMGPLSLLVSGLPDTPWDVDTPVLVDGACLVVDGLVIDVDGLTPPAPAVWAPRAAGWRRAMAAALGTVPPPPAELGPGLGALRAGDLPSAVALLAGRGEGLTPAGDDVLAGWAGWWAAEDDPRAATLARAVEGRSAHLGHAYLECAVRGELPEAATRVLNAVRAGDAGAATRRAPGLRAWGATSGAALLWGAAAAAIPMPAGVVPG